MDKIEKGLALLRIAPHLCGKKTSCERNMQKIMQIAGDPGSGKTTKCFDRMISKPGRYVYAAPRTDLLDDALRYLFDHGLNTEADAIYRENAVSKYSVDERITQWLKKHADDHHAVLLITHAALINADTEQFLGWSLILDEVPSHAVYCDTLHCRASLPAVRELFDLEPDPDGRTNIMVLRARPGNVHDLLGDPYLCGLANLWKRARQGTVFVECRPHTDDQTGEVDRWADIAKKPCSVLSVWSFDSLEAFEYVSIAAAGLEHSLVHKCNPRDYEIDPTFRPASNAQIRIYYFDPITKAGSTYFASAEGLANFEKIGSYLRKLDQPLGFWTCNNLVKDAFQRVMPAGYSSPMQEGSNRLRSETSCAAFYSAKRTRADGLLCRVYAITDDDIERAREWEHLCQFVMRGRVRDHDFAGRYDVYVYDKGQAERLAVYMGGIGFPDVAVAHIDLKLKIRPERRNAGRKPLLSREEARERKRQRDRDRYARKKNGTCKPLLFCTDDQITEQPTC